MERLRNSATAIDSATRGRSLHARVSLLERLEARKTKSPFVDIKQPDIQLHTEGPLEDQTVLNAEDYSVAFDRQIMEHVSFSNSGRREGSYCRPQRHRKNHPSS